MSDLQEKVARALQKVTDSRGECMATGNCLGLAQAAIDTVLDALLSDYVVKSAYEAFDSYNYSESAKVKAALTAAIEAVRR